MANIKCSVCYFGAIGQCCGQSESDDEKCEYFAPDDYSDESIMAIVEEGRREYRNAWWEYIAQYE